MAGINGSVKWGIVPLAFTGSELANMAYDYRSNRLVSANNPMRYQIIWTSGSMSEDKEPTIANAVVNSGGTTTSGDIVNVIFDVYSTVEYPLPAATSDWDLVASIKKSRDISNKHYINGNGASGHRFTIDISTLCKDLLSYSLVPIGKGTWQDFRYGGMNGGLTMQDNVTQNISDFNVSKNGCFRTIRVKPRFEILNADSGIEESTHDKGWASHVRVINSVPQFDRDNPYYYGRYYIYRWSSNDTDKPKSFLSHYPNFTQTSTAPSMKSVRTDEEAEWLYFYVGQTKYGDSAFSDAILSQVYLRGTTSDGNTFYLDEFSNTLDKGTNNGQANTFNREQQRICVQNVSISYINANDGTDYTNAKDDDGIALTVAAYPNGIITDTTTHYYLRIKYRRTTGSNTEYRMSEFRYFKVDRENENPYGFVRFHWLNRLGGIDSYTAKRDVVEGLSISRDTIERKQGDRTWNQNQHSITGTVLNDSVYHSNTMRGGDIYKGGREVMNVNADRNYSVYTEPLNRSTSEWLEEIMTSPNVWIEMESESTKHLNAVNPYQRPSTKEYMPVIITNGDIETVNQEQGLVKFNIEYTLAHKITTQRN